MITMKKSLIIIAGLVSLCFTSHAFKGQEIAVRSESMNKDVNVTVITPDGYKKGEAFPVIYLIHGHGDNHTSWSKDGVVGRLADKYKTIVVMPDAVDSWYFDSPMKPEYKYETFMTKELVPYIDNNYKTIKDRKGRAITGQSMGGHGAMYLAFRNQDLFSCVGALSGGVDIRPFPKNWGLAVKLGPIEEYPENWEKNTVINLTHLLKPGSLEIVMDCGTQDFFYQVNCNLHDKLLAEGIPHDFYSRPGGHTWTYWMNSIKYIFMFFDDRLEDAKL